MKNATGFIQAKIREAGRPGGGRRVEYEWVGGDFGRLPLECLEYAPVKPGQVIQMGGVRLRVLEVYATQNCILVIRERGLSGWLFYWRHWTGRAFETFYHRLIITAAVWGLADYDPASLPHWKQVKILQRLLQKLERA